MNNALPEEAAEPRASHIAHVFICDVTDCPSRSEETFHMWLMSEPLRPCPPDGWRHYFGALICPKHEVRLVIDGRDWFEVKSTTLRKVEP